MPRCRCAGAPRLAFQPRAAALIATLAVAVLLVSCEQAGTTDPGDPPSSHTYSLSASTLPSAIAEAGATASPDPSVRVLMDGQPVSGLRVDWAAGDGGSASPAFSSTDASGLATTTWQLASGAGVQRLTASVLNGVGTVAFSTSVFAAPPVRVSLAQRTIALGDIGDTVSLRATATDRFGNVVASPALTYTSLSSTIVSVTQAGLVRGLAAGSGRVVVTGGTGADTAAIEVRRRAASFAVAPRSVSLNALGATTQLTATVRDSRGDAITDAAVTWVSADTAVAGVSASGLVTTRSNGRTTIHAKLDNLSDSVLVSVAQQPARVSVTPAAPTMVSGDTLRLTGTLVDSLGSPVPGASLGWQSADTGIVKVAANGLLTARRVGRTDVVASSGGLSAKATVTVVAGAVVTIALTPPSAALVVGETVTFAVNGWDAQGNPATVSPAFSSLDPGVATVSPVGVCTGVTAGTATIRAVVAGLTADARVTVVARPAVARIRIDPHADTLNYIGATRQLSATILDVAGQPIAGLSPVWTSLDPASASVSQNGLVTMRVGTGPPGRQGVKVVASYGALADTTTVVLRQYAKTFSVSPTWLPLQEGDSGFVTVAMADSGGSAIPEPGFQVWMSWNAAYAVFARPTTQSPSGVWFKGLTAGTNTIKIAPTSWNMMGPAAFVTVTVSARVAGIRVSPSSVSLDPAHPNAQLSATRVDANGQPIACAPFTYASLDPGIVTVSSGGLVAAPRTPFSIPTNGTVSVACGGETVYVTVSIAADTHASVTRVPAGTASPRVRVARPRPAVGNL